jgi:hypothetical protein
MTDFQRRCMTWGSSQTQQGGFEAPEWPEARHERQVISLNKDLYDAIRDHNLPANLRQPLKAVLIMTFLHQLSHCLIRAFTHQHSIPTDIEGDKLEEALFGGTLIARWLKEEDWGKLHLISEFSLHWPGAGGAEESMHLPLVHRKPVSSIVSGGR